MSGKYRDCTCVNDGKLREPPQSNSGGGDCPCTIPQTNTSGFMGQPPGISRNSGSDPHASAPRT